MSRACSRAADSMSSCGRRRGAATNDNVIRWWRQTRHDRRCVWPLLRSQLESHRACCIAWVGACAAHTVVHYGATVSACGIHTHCVGPARPSYELSKDAARAETGLSCCGTGAAARTASHNTRASSALAAMPHLQLMHSALACHGVCAATYTTSIYSPCRISMRCRR